MTELTALDLALGVAVLATTAATVLPRTRSVQAMSFLGLGVLMTLVWLRLGSVDVALAEAALGSGLLSAVLVWLAVRSPDPHVTAGAPGASGAGQPARPRPTWVRGAVGIVCGAVIVTVTAGVWLRVEQTLPAWEEPLAQNLADTGVTHEITAVLLGFRAYDTLLESAVLMLAGVTALALGRDGGLTPARYRVPVVPPPLRCFVRAVAPGLVLLGLWLLFAGSSDSGGAFQSGAVLAGALILLRSAGVPLDRLTVRWLRPLLIVGVIGFILTGVLAVALGNAWLGWSPEWSFAAMLTVEIALTAGITAGLYMLFLGLEDPDGPTVPELRGVSR
ncbi:MnhB domain-containing protein [Kocuria sp.]|uniref:MnhB domain-containing protein n=1 Tax=Kocuria sp. TaxID=1871328 RepID=UPI0025C6CAFF|nr:MnhB domain-containing protein [Kocuria sp.]